MYLDTFGYRTNGYIQLEVLNTYYYDIPFENRKPL